MPPSNLGVLPEQPEIKIEKTSVDEIKNEDICHESENDPLQSVKAEDLFIGESDSLLYKVCY